MSPTDTTRTPAGISLCERIDRFGMVPSTNSSRRKYRAAGDWSPPPSANPPYPPCASCDPESPAHFGATGSGGWHSRCIRWPVRSTTRSASRQRRPAARLRRIQVRLYHHPSDRLPRKFRQQDRILGHRRRFTERFQDGYRIPNRNAFSQQVLEDFLHRCHRQQFRHQILDHFGIFLRDPIQNILGVLSRQ